MMEAAPENMVMEVGDVMLTPRVESIIVEGGVVGVAGAGTTSGGVGPDCMITAGGTSVNTS